MLFAQILFLFLAAVHLADYPDPCTRTFVMPRKVVWQTVAGQGYNIRGGVKNADFLLAPKHGQVPETSDYANRNPTCALENSGNSVGIVLDFGKELHGGIQICVSAKSQRLQRVRIRFGESVTETFSDALACERGAGNDHAMRDFEITLPTMGTIEVGNSGFRFVRLDLVSVGRLDLESVRAIELKRPMDRLGAFKSSDERLNRVFETAVRTVHLCCQNYLWDGIKRDRLVWMGDTHPEAMAVLNVFGDVPVVSESLDYMASTTDPKTEWMNCMGPYTLWWVRNVAEWYRFTGDRRWLTRHRDFLATTLRRLATDHITASNTFEGVRRPFLDWPTEHNRPAVFAGMQGLALTTFREGAFLSDALCDAELADICRGAAEKLARQAPPDPNGAKSAAAVLALSGLRDPREMFDRVLGRDGHTHVSTFYGYYMIEAMSAVGEKQRALDTVRDYWGGMLDVGATSFWENFDLDWTNNCFRIDELPVAGKKDVHGDYGEFCYPGFRHSLCHGWSAGPAAWCINHVLGIRILEPGCRKIEVRPFLGDLDWAEGAMALPNRGAIRVRVERGVNGVLRTEIEAPEGVKVDAPTGAVIVSGRVPRSCRPAGYGGEKWKAYRERFSAQLETARAGGAPVVFLGDSITHYWEDQDRGRDVWERHFASGRYRAVNFGIKGDSTCNVIYRLQNGLLDGFAAKVVVLQIGTNNLNHDTPAEIRRGVAACLDLIFSKQPTATVVLHPVPMCGERPADERRLKAQAANIELAALADGKRVLWCDWSHRMLQPDGTIAKSMIPDHCHPLRPGYELWAESLLPVLDKALGTSEEER